MSRNDEISCMSRLKEAFLANQTATIVFDNTDGVARKVITSCAPNPSENDFPDFLFDDGNCAIEHFLVGSAKEGKKGSEFNRVQRVEKEAAAEFMRKQEKTFSSTPPIPNSYGTAVFETRYEGFTYDAFLDSLDRNFSSHVASLKKSGRTFENVIFLIEQQTPRLNIYEYGEFARFYLLFQDKRALEILTKCADEVRYVIYFAGGTVEAIDLSMLPEMKAKAGEDKDIRSGRLAEINLLLTITI